MSRTPARRHWIGIVLAVSWLVGATAVLTEQHNVEIGRQIRQCHQLQDDARSSNLCADTNSLDTQPLCHFKDVDCDRWPLEEAHYVTQIVRFAVVPVAFAWVAFYCCTRLFRHRGKL